jgi:hypothetical protein
MIKKEINFADLIAYFKKNQVPTFDEDIDKFGGYFITAARIAAVIIAPDPISKISVFCAGIDAASLRASKLFNWLPEKFKYKDREKFAIQRYELSSYVNFMLLQIAIKNGVKVIVMPYLKTILSNLELNDEAKQEIEKRCKEYDKEREVMNLPVNCMLSMTDIKNHALKLIDPIFSVLEKHIDNFVEPELKKNENLFVIIEWYLENIVIQYQAFLVHFSEEFPEFALWADMNQKEKIIKELKAATKSIEDQNKKEHEKFITHIEELTTKIDALRDNSFIKESGFPSFISTYKKLFKIQEEHISKVLRSRTIENIVAHQNQIRSELNKPLLENTDVEQIIYPKNKNIYIAQSFEAISYKKKEHKKGFLTTDSLGEKAAKGENIGNYLLELLVDPNYATKPIIILGNPGAGKSMLSKMFAGELCETNDFIPFLIRLRSVASSSASISEHINKGLANSIENLSDINWLEWAKEFRNRIPVIIMDGFDELMQTSNRELNGYIDAIREFQEKAINSGVCARIILTSRITVMQDVSIPEGAKLIKLDSFDNKRMRLWIDKWNNAQEKPNYRFAIPQNDKIELLAKEPLLLFMLAVYDFENGELQKMANDKNFNQSKLYDSLLERFIKRQLEKHADYKNTNESQKEKENELFRLRLGMIALMMFMNDTTSRDIHKLTEEMTAFGIHKSTIQTEHVLGGFFFIHENKSTTEIDTEKFNYEFLHKTFGEFLAADFLLRVAQKQYKRIFGCSQEIIAKKETFNFCFGYNWLHKHNNIQNFLFEHASQILRFDSNESIFIINNIIKTDLKELFDKLHQAFPVTDIRLLEKKAVIEHLGIYSQNLIFLWLAIANRKQPIEFEIFDINENIEESVKEPKYESQDRDEISKNKLLWKRLTKLWTLVGNYSATAKLAEWISVNEKWNIIELRIEKAEVIHNYSDSASVSCNDFELLLSYFDNEYKLSEGHNTLQIIDTIITNKPVLFSLAVDAVLHRFHDLFLIEGANLFYWFLQLPIELNKKQQLAFVKNAGMIKWHISPKSFAEIIYSIADRMPSIFDDNIQTTTAYLKILVDLRSHLVLGPELNHRILEKCLHRFSDDNAKFEKYDPLELLEFMRFLCEVYKQYPLRKNNHKGILNELFSRLTRDMGYFFKESIYFTFEYLKFANEFLQSYPVVKKDFKFDEAISILLVDVRRIAIENQHAVLELLKLLNTLQESLLDKGRFANEYLIELLGCITEEWRNVIKDNLLNPLEFIKILLEFGNTFQLTKYLPHELIHEAFRQLSKDLIYIVRDNSKDVIAYLKVMKLYYSYYPNLQFKEKKDDEPLSRISKEMDMVFINMPQYTLIYLELLLINSKYYWGRSEEKMMEQIIVTLQKQEKKYSTIFIKRAALLLMQYDAPSIYIKKVFDTDPKFKNLFSTSPEFVREILDATAEINDHDGFN